MQQQQLPLAVGLARTLSDVLPKIMEEGCLAGGDALIMQSSDTYSSGGRDGVPVQRISATVIRWSSE